MLKNNFKNFLIISLIFLMMSGWIFSGWPRIWPLGELGVNKIRIPPEIQEARAVETLTNGAFLSDSTGWTLANTGGTLAWDGTQGSPVGSLKGATPLGKIQSMVGTATQATASITADSTVTLNFKWAKQTLISAVSARNVIKVQVAKPSAPTTYIDLWSDSTVPTVGAAISFTSENLNVSATFNETGSYNFRLDWTDLYTANKTDAQCSAWFDEVSLDSVPPTTTLSTGTNPGNSTIAPGGSITSVNGFTLTTSGGTDAITAIIVNLSTNSGVGTLTITDGADAVLGSIGGGTGTGIVTGSNSISITSTNATIGGTAFKVKVTPLSHTDINMPAPDGGEYAITGVVTDWTGTNTKAGQATDTSDTVTIDNNSPADVTDASGTAGAAQVSLSWTNPVDADYHSAVALRSTSAVVDTPVEGTTYIVGNTIGASTVACVVTTPTASCIDTDVINGTAYHYKIFTRDNFANYSTPGIVPTDSPFTPVAASLTFSVDGNGSFPSLTPGSLVATSSILQVKTNNSTGFYITVERDDADTTLDDNSDISNNISDKTEWISPSATTTPGNATASSTELQTLQFRVRQAGTDPANYASFWWGIDDTTANAIFAGFTSSTAPTVNKKIIIRSTPAVASTTSYVLYNLDVANTQKTGTYSGSITYTATANP